MKEHDIGDEPELHMTAYKGNVFAGEITRTGANSHEVEQQAATQQLDHFAAWLFRHWKAAESQASSQPGHRHSRGA